VRQILPYFQEQSVDVAIIDAVWNGVWQAMKIASTTEAFDVNIAPHNFYSHLATMMNTHFAAAVPNLRILEHDVDRLPWDLRPTLTHSPGSINFCPAFPVSFLRYEHPTSPGSGLCGILHPNFLELPFHALR
jgi:galactonate dehydratase